MIATHAIAEQAQTDALVRTNQLRAILQNLINATDRTLAALRAGIREGSGDRRAVGDVTDDIIHEADLATVTARATSLTQTLAAATDALRRLNVNDGSYGICHCGNPIGIKRLEALPFATTCILCQQQRELSSRLTRRQVGARYTS